MRRNLCLFFIVLAFCFISGFSLPKESGDKVWLDIIATYQCLPVFNYAAKMAAVDLSPYKPGQPKYAHTTFFASRSKDTLTHGGKIFRLRARYDTPYAYDNSQPSGQTLVMETWNYRQIYAKQENDNNAVRTNDSTFLVPTTPADFFIMYKPERDTLNTDKGWVYARVNASGKKVLQKGLVAGCMGCHSASKTDRVLGAK